MEDLLVAGIGKDMDRFYAITWDLVKSESEKDSLTRLLSSMVKSGFPSTRSEIPPEIAQY